MSYYRSKNHTKITPPPPLNKTLNKWHLGPLSKLLYINPPTTVNKLKPESNCSFLGMEDVDNQARVIRTAERPFLQVRSGFTRFATNDVLFAKITPCMENGKGALVTDLINDVGFGSTEFHVLRAKSPQSTLFAYYWSINPQLRLAAKNQMVGSAGQQRVPADFFDKFLIGIPPLDEQEQIGKILFQADATLRQHEQKLTKLRRLKTGLMRDLLTLAPATTVPISPQHVTLSA